MKKSSLIDNNTPGKKSQGKGQQSPKNLYFPKDFFEYPENFDLTKKASPRRLFYFMRRKDCYGTMPHPRRIRKHGFLLLIPWSNVPTICLLVL